MRRAETGGDLGDFVAKLPGEEEQLGVETETVDPLQAKEVFGDLPAQPLEPCLSVAEGKHKRRPDQQVEGGAIKPPGHTSAVTLGKQPGADHDVVLDQPAVDLVEMVQRIRKIAVDEANGVSGTPG